VLKAVLQELSDSDQLALCKFFQSTGETPTVETTLTVPAIANMGFAHLLTFARLYEISPPTTFGQVYSARQALQKKIASLKSPMAEWANLDVAIWSTKVLSLDIKFLRENVQDVLGGLSTVMCLKGGIKSHAVVLKPCVFYETGPNNSITRMVGHRVYVPATQNAVWLKPGEYEVITRRAPVLPPMCSLWEAPTELRLDLQKKAFYMPDTELKPWLVQQGVTIAADFNRVKDTLTFLISSCMAYASKVSVCPAPAPAVEGANPEQAAKDNSAAEAALEDALKEAATPASAAEEAKPEEAARDSPAREAAPEEAPKGNAVACKDRDEEVVTPTRALGGAKSAQDQLLADNMKALDAGYTTEMGQVAELNRPSVKHDVEWRCHLAPLEITYGSSGESYTTTKTREILCRGTKAIAYFDTAGDERGANLYMDTVRVKEAATPAQEAASEEAPKKAASVEETDEQSGTESADDAGKQVEDEGTESADDAGKQVEDQEAEQGEEGSDAGDESADDAGKQVDEDMLAGAAEEAKPEDAASDKAAQEAAHTADVDQDMEIAHAAETADDDTKQGAEKPTTAPGAEEADSAQAAERAAAYFDQFRRPKFFPNKSRFPSDPVDAQMVKVVATTQSQMEKLLTFFICGLFFGRSQLDPEGPEVLWQMYSPALVITVQGTAVDASQVSTDLGDNEGIVYESFAGLVQAPWSAVQSISTQVSRGVVHYANRRAQACEEAAKLKELLDACVQAPDAEMQAADAQADVEMEEEQDKKEEESEEKQQKKEEGASEKFWQEITSRMANHVSSFHDSLLQDRTWYPEEVMDNTDCYLALQGFAHAADKAKTQYEAMMKHKRAWEECESKMAAKQKLFMRVVTENEAVKNSLETWMKKATKQGMLT